MPVANNEHGNNRLLSVKQWDSLRMAAVAGVPYRTLAIKFGITNKDGKPDTNAIRQRAFKEHWPVPSRILESAKRSVRSAQRTGQRASVQPGSRGAGEDGINFGTRENKLTLDNGPLFSQREAAQDAAVIISDNLAEIGREGTLAASQIALRSLKRAPETLPIASLAEAKTAMQIVRIAAGMDSGEGNQLQVNLFGPASAVTGSANAFRTFDVDQVHPGGQDAQDEPERDLLADPMF